MRGRWLAAFAVTILLAGCVTPGERMAQNDCEAMGYRRGTELFLQCMALKQQDRQARAAAMRETGIAIMRAGQPRQPIVCTTTPNPLSGSTTVCP